MRNNAIDATLKSRSLSAAIESNSKLMPAEITIIIYDTVMQYLLGCYHAYENELSDLPSYKKGGPTICNMQDILATKFPRIQHCLGNLAKLQHRYECIIQDDAQAPFVETKVFIDILNVTAKWFFLSVPDSIIENIVRFYDGLGVGVSACGNTYSEADRLYIASMLGVSSIKHFYVCDEMRGAV